MTTVEELLAWILLNRKGRAFDYDEKTLLQELTTCTNENTILVITDADNIVGVVCWKETEVGIHVFDILSTRGGVLRKMLSEFYKRYPNKIITGTRMDSSVVTYNQKVIQRLYNYGKRL